MATGLGEHHLDRRGWSWAREVSPREKPQTADAFAEAVILAICSASVTPAVGRLSFERCRRALLSGGTARLGFRHPGKAEAVDRVWRERQRLFRDYQASADKLAFLATLPWIGPVAKRSAARSLGLATDPGETRSVA